MEKIKILVLDECPLICETYKTVFEKINKKNDLLNIDSIICHDRTQKFFEKENLDFNLIILNIGEELIGHFGKYSNEEIGLLLRKKNKPVKIMVTTNLKNKVRLFSIYRALRPEGFLIKKELTIEIFENAILNLLENRTYNSHTINEVLRTELCRAIILDNLDRQILYHLSMGLQTKNLTQFLPLSLSGIEKRKRKLAEKLGIDNSSTHSILNAARSLEIL